MKQLFLIITIFFHSFICCMEMPPKAAPQQKTIVSKILAKKDYEALIKLIKNGYEFSQEEIIELSQDVDFWVSTGYFFLTNARIKSTRVLSLKELAAQEVAKKMKSKKLKELPDDVVDVIILSRDEIKLGEIEDRINYYFEKNPKLLLAFWHSVIKKLSIAQSTDLLEKIIKKWGSIKPIENETIQAFHERLSGLEAMILSLTEEQCVLRDAIIDLLKRHNILNPLINRARLQAGRAGATAAGLMGAVSSFSRPDFPKFIQSAESREKCKKLCYADLLKKLGKKADKLMKEIEKIRSQKKS